MEVIAVIRDIAIILLALINIVILAILAFIAFQALRLVRAIQRELPEFTGKAKETMTTVQGTTDFIGTTAAKPLIGVAQFLAAARQFLRIMALGRKQEVNR